MRINKAMGVKVIVYEDNDDLRDSISQILEATDSIEFLAAYPNCEFVENQTDIYKPEVVLMDIDMPVVNGIRERKS